MICRSIRGIARDAAKQNYRFSALVLGIVKSPPFQMTVTRSVDAEVIPPAGAAGATTVAATPRALDK